MRTRARAEDHATSDRSRGRAAVRGRDEADGWGVRVSVPQRERGEGGPDERDPPVNDPQREEGGSARVGRTGMGRPAGRFPCHSLHSTVFLFLFVQFLSYV